MEMESPEENAAPAAPAIPASEGGGSPAAGLAAGLCVVAVLSGCAALVFETLWFRSAGLAFGNGVWASSIVLASFMAGLATGNYVAARVAARVRRPLRFYAGLELAIGVSGAALVLALPLVTGALAGLFGSLRESTWLLNAVRVPLSFALMMIPATAMGATLPVLVKALSTRDPRFGRVLGRLYGWNTLGAVVGALLGEAFLIGLLGVRGSALVAAGIDAVAAGLALLLARSIEPLVPVPAARRAARIPGRARLLLLAAFGAGAVFLALEVVWFRFLSLFVYGTSLVFAVLLAVVLAGIGAGGLAASRWLRGGRAAAPALVPLALVSAAGVLLTYAGFGVVYAAVLAPGVAAASGLHVALLAAPLMLPVALLSGVLFTALGEAARREIGEEARTTGLLTLANTVGAAGGSLVAGFVLLPQLGIERSLLLLAAGYVAVAACAGAPFVSLQRGRAGLVSAAALAAVVVLWAGFPRGSLAERFLVHPTAPFLEETSSVVAVREGRLETLVYLRTDRFERPHYWRLFTDGFSMSATNVHSRRYMKGFVYLPVALHPDPRSALLISYGVGSTARALADTDGLERIDVVDISEEILSMGHLVFERPEDDPLRDPRVHVHVEDGRFFLQTTRRRFDLITGEPPPPKYAGVVNLYTREYFALLRERLTDGGMTSYWLPVHNLDEADALSIVRAFCDVFPDCSLWSGAGLDWILLGSRDGPGGVSADHVGRQWRDPRVAPELRALGFEDPASLGATFLAGPERLAAVARDAAPLVDDFPHRLSMQPITPDRAHGLPLFRELMDVDAARRAFADSAFVERVWPREWVEPTLAAFGWQRAVNGRFVYAPDAAGSNDDLHRVLAASTLTTLPLWMLGSDADEQRIASAIRGPRARRAEVQRVLGVGDMAQRRYAQAARRFRAARGRAVRAPRLMHLEIFALCMAGDVDAAAELARRLVRAVPATARDDAHWRWMHSTFGLPDPRRSRSS